MSSRKSVLLAVAVVIILIIAGGAYYWWQTSLTPKEEVIKIGFIAPLSGAAADIGKDLRIGAEKAVEEINNAGGILGKKIILVLGDDQSKPEVGISVAEKLITQEECKILTGVFHSSVGIAVMDVAAKYKIPLIISTAASTEIGKKVLTNYEKYKYIFQTNINSTGWQLAYIYPVQYILDQGLWKPKTYKLAILAEDTDWGRASAELWKNYWTQKGWEVTIVEVTSPDLTDFYSILTRIKDKGVTLIKAEYSKPPTLAAFVKQCRELDVKALIVLGSAHWSKDFVNLAGEAGDYTLGTFEHIPDEFKGKLEKWGAGDYAVQSYVAIYLIKDAIERAKTIDPDTLVKALEQTDYTSIRGRHKFDLKTHCQIADPKYISPAGAQLIKGKFYFITPPKVERQFELPPYLKE